MRMNIFIGPTYYMRLKHIVKDKINYRAKGPRTVLTRQTVQGRANDGGLRVGEQERDAIVAHGLAYFLKESMLVRGDEYLMAVCNLTGMTAIYNNSLNLFISPFADGPVKFVGEIADSQKIDRITKYGRSFSLVRIPYAFKLLIQELATLNINMRIITDQNIDQLSSMNPSSEIRDFDDIDPQAIIKSQTSLKKTTVKEEPTISLSVKETQEQSDKLLDKAISENIIDVKKLEKEAEQEEFDEAELLDALEKVSSPKLTFGEAASFKPDKLDDDSIPDINTVPLIGTKSVSINPLSKKEPEPQSQPEPDLKMSKSPEQEKIVTTAIDDPETPDDLEAENLQLLTDIIEEEGEEQEEAKEKTVDIK